MAAAVGSMNAQRSYICMLETIAKSISEFSDVKH